MGFRKLSGSVQLVVAALCFFQLTVTALSSSSCYLPNGTFFSSDTPCNKDATASSCCGDGWTCLSDGVCSLQQEDSDGTNHTFYYRGTCTDQSWDDPGCLNICRDGSDGIQGTSDNTSLALVKCSRGDGQDYYCCTNDPTCRCDTQQGAVYSLGSTQPFTVTVVGSSTWANEVASTPPTSTAKITAPNPITSATSTKTSSHTTSSTSGGSAAAATTTSSSSSSVTAIPSTSDSSGSSSHLGLALGLGIGLGVALILVAILTFFLVRSRRRRAAGTAAAAAPLVGGYSPAPASGSGGYGPNMSEIGTPNEQTAYAEHQAKVNQMNGQYYGAELAASPGAHEADSHPVGSSREPRIAELP